MFPSKWKLVIYGLIILMGCIVAAPNFFTTSQLEQWPSWLPSRQVPLGLDLRGGASVLLQVDTRALRAEQLEVLLDQTRSALREARIRDARTASSGKAVVVRLADRSEADTALRALRTLATTQGQPASVALTLARDGSIELEPTEAALAERRRTAIEQSVEIVRRRIDAIGVAEPTVQGLGEDRILVQMPGVHDRAAIRTLLGSTAKLTFHRVATAMTSQSLPPGYTRLPSVQANGSYVIEQRPMLQGDRLTQAAAAFDQRTHQPIVTFRLDGLGAKQFAEVTTAHVGEPFAIVLDGRVISAPVINEPITGGSGQIQGNFTVEETASLAALLRAGALPVPLDIIKEGSVGADLGSDSIRIGALTGLAGLALVLTFMTVLYGAWGLVANLALLVNVTLTIAVLTLFGITLTLPGIAGIVLGIGLAVDANVLINERIREETRSGKSAFAALQSGFQRAYSTIVDSNVTTLIATALLFWVGSGPVQGFAVTMALGLAISMLTAVSVVKAAMTVWVLKRKPAQFAIGSLLPTRWRAFVPGFRFMRAPFLGLGLSLILSIASVALFLKPGLNYGVDFVGGVMLEARTPAPADLARLRASLEALHFGEVSLQAFDGGSGVLVRIEKPANADDHAVADIATHARAAILELEPGATFERDEVAWPKVSSELADTGILAVLLASVAMLIYIWMRFDWHFAVGAIATLILDVTKTLGFFALTGIEFNLTAIAAVLTLIGYSVNDKVVVYDRIREHLSKDRTTPLRDIIDRSINETLGRSLYTSATALLAMLPMAIWGGTAVESFAVPMVFGIVIAASSSIFIAAPILLFLGDWWRRREAFRW